MVLSIISAAVFVPSMVAVDSIYLDYAEMYGRRPGYSSRNRSQISVRLLLLFKTMCISHINVV